MHRALSRRQRAAGTFAELSGKVLGFAARRAGTLPGIGGAVLVSVGLGQMYRPLFLVGLGLFGLLLDRRMP